ncbi:MAG: aminoacyl--tRNA ligase-related protein [bacterium]|nr:aminoacyl--tRNA ligase-related protein [bacterium]
MVNIEIVVYNIFMLQSKLFSKSTREFPKDEESLNAKLLIRAGFIRKISAGVYAYLPLGLRVLQNINNIVREEMNALGAEELLMPALIPKAIWEKSARWDVDIAYKIKDEGSSEYGLGWTHEEVITEIATHNIFSYSDLPRAVYQIQTKFRKEPRAKSGILRGREFTMKDLYSFHVSEGDLDVYYKKVIESYKKIFNRLSLNAKVVEAGGGLFTKNITHEFQVISDSGEDVIYFCDKCNFAQNKEIAKVVAGDNCPSCGKDKIGKTQAIEVANVFRQGTKYSEAFGLNIKDEGGKSSPVWHGSYGIGISRIMGTLVEVYNDARGIIWPEAVAPFRVHLIALGLKNQDKCQEIYNALQEKGIEVLYDERSEVSVGEKFADADLIGIPLRAVVSDKTGDKIEIKHRNSTEVKLVTLSELIKSF